MTEYVSTILKFSVHQPGDHPVYSAGATHVSLDDEGGGPFLTLTQSPDVPEDATIRLELDELKAILATAETMMNQKGLIP